MIIESGDRKRSVNIGAFEFWHSVYSTVSVLLKNEIQKIHHAIEFLRTGKCGPDSALRTAREINLIRDMLSQFPPEEAIWDCDKLEKQAPWKENLSPVVTSCANLYTTSDGADLLYEIVSILCYASVVNVDVHIM